MIAMNKRPDWLIEHKAVLDGQPITYSYDKEGDILEIIFQRGGGTGVDLTDNIVLRFDRNRGQALSLILISFSKLIQPTKFGPSSFPLTALDELPPAMQQVVLKILQSFPVNHFMKIMGLYGAHAGELHPITYLEQPADLPHDLIPA